MCAKMRGLSPLISAVFLIAITVTLATLVSSWLVTQSTDTASEVRNTTREQLACRFADVFIKNATLECNDVCESGTEHNVTVSLRNTGKKSLRIDRIVLQNTTGHATTFDLNETKQIDVGETQTYTNTTFDSCASFNNTIDKVIVTSITCPSTAFDELPGSEVTYSNCN